VTKTVVIPRRCWTAQTLVQIAERLVEQKHLRLTDQGPRQRDALLLAARQCRRRPLGEVGQADQIERVERLLARLGPFGARPTHPQREHHVVQDGHVRPYRIRLEDDADRPAMRPDVHPATRVGHHLATDLDHTVVGAFEAGDEPQRGGLAAPARPEQGDQLALRDLQVDAVDGIGGDRSSRVALDEVRQLDHAGDSLPARDGWCRVRSRPVIGA
jgi:hypothetical protein